MARHLLMKWLLRFRSIGNNLDAFHEFRSLIFLFVRVFEGNSVHRPIHKQVIQIAFLFLLLEHSKPFK